MRASRWAGIQSVWVTVAALTMVMHAKAASPPVLVVQSGHTNGVTSASFSPGGKLVVTASFDATAILWDAASGQKLRTLTGHTTTVRSASFSPDGRQVVTASYDGTAILWDAASGQKLRTLAGRAGFVTSASFSPDGRQVATASYDDTAILWDAASGQKLRTLAGHTGGVNSASFSPDGREVVTSSFDNTTVIWDAASGQKLRTFAGRTASFSPDGRQVVTGSHDGTAILWDATSGQKIRTLAGHTKLVNSATFSPDGRQIVTASYDNTAIIWDAASGQKLRTLAGHAGGVESASFSPDGRAVVTASANTAIVWDAASGQKLRTLAGHATEMSSASFSPDGRRIVTAQADNMAMMWDAASGQKFRTLAGHAGAVSSASFSPDGREVVTASWDRTANVWDAASGLKLRTLAGHAGAVSSASFSPDGRLVVTASDDTAIVWDAAGGQRLQLGILDVKILAGLLAGSPHLGGRAAYSPDGREVVTASRNGPVIVWDAASGQRLRTLAGQTGWVSAAAFSPNGRHIVTSSSDGTAIVWDAASGQKLRTLAGHTAWVLSAAFSPEGSSVVTASWDSTAIVWGVSSGQKLRTLAGHTGWVSSASFSPDGKVVLTASQDGTTRLWDAATGSELCSLISFDAGREWLAVTREGYYQGSLAAEQYVRWRIDGENGEWPRLAGPEQFRDTFYRPDLFRHLLAEGDVSRALARADAERGKATRPTDIPRELPPVALITSPENHAKLSQPDTRVRAVVTSVGIHPVESLQLELNGQPEGRIQRVQEPKPGRVDAEWPSVRLRPGENTIRVIAKAGGTTGPSDPVKVTYVSRGQIKVRLQILVIGVDKYKLAPDAGGYRELRHAASGARKVGEAFARYGGGLYNEVLPPKVLLDQEATKDNILDALDQFSREMAKDDVGVIFYAGHGDKSNDRLYLTAHDTDKTRLVRTSVSASQVRDLLAGTKGRVYLFLDACHSGAITQRSGNGDSIHEDLVRELRREATGTVIATACRGDESANEDEELGGFFTHALVEGLSGKARSPNGAVYAKGLKVYVEDRVKELTRPLDARHQQRPYFDGSEELMDLPLAKP